MGWAVFNQAGAVAAEHHRQFLQADVVEDAVHGTLQEGAVDGDDRTQSASRHTGGKNGAVFFGDADIVDAGGMLVLEGAEAGAGEHAGGDGDDARVAFGEAGEVFGEGVGEGEAALLAGADRVGLGVGDFFFLEAVAALGVFVSGGEATAFFGQYVEQHGGAGELADAAQGGDQLRQVVAVDRADVAEAEFFEDDAGDDEGFGGFFELGGGGDDAVADAGDAVHQVAQRVAEGVVAAVGDQAVEVTGERADVGRDAHLVVIEDNDEVFGGVCRGVESFERDAAAEGAITDDGDDFFLAAFAVASGGEADGGGEDGAGMARAEGVVDAFIALQEAGAAAGLAQGFAE